MASEIHPDVVFERIISDPKIRSPKRDRLRKIHSFCSDRFAQGNHEFNIAVMRTELESVGIANNRTFDSADGPEYPALVNAWQHFADSLDFPPCPDAPENHPDRVFRRLLQVHRKWQQPAVLRSVHRICKERFDRGDVNFSGRSVVTEAIGRINQATRFPLNLVRMPRAFYELTAAWGALATARGHSVNTDDDLMPPEDKLAKVLRSPQISTEFTNYLKQIQIVCEARFARGEIDFGTISVAADLIEAGVSTDRKLANRLSSNEKIAALLRTWQQKSDALWISEAEGTSITHPHAVFRRVRGKIDRADTLRVALRIHRVCFLQHSKGLLDFSIKTIGKELAAQGIIAETTLRRSISPDLRNIVAAWDEYARPWLRNLDQVPPLTEARRQKSHDPSLEWVRRDLPELEDWRRAAVEWLATTKKGLQSRIGTINSFFDLYLRRPDALRKPVDFFRRSSQLPDLSEVIGTSTARHSRSNQLHSFFDWVLLRDFSIDADDDTLVISPEFRNPGSRMQQGRASRHWQTVRTPLPYGYIHELRSMLAQGPHLRDWTFAQNAQGAVLGELGKPSRDWYDVEWSEIDESDPDCVWRERVFARNKRRHSVFQMWSPVRWVALLIKLLLPLRTGQVRLLDSGESDTINYVQGEWVENVSQLAKSGPNGWQQGVFRRNQDPADRVAISSLLFINTNKTADQEKSGPEKGYVMPWFRAPGQTEDVFYWLEKIRNWQSKYNPTPRRVHWRELDGRHINAKTSAQLEEYPECCFLFRMPENGSAERLFPVSDGVLSHAWACLLKALQEKIAARGETHPGGALIELVELSEKGRNDALFPLHSLRVSLITAFALDGQVPFPILQKLVGHSRLLMTLYYTKPGATRISEVLSEAADRLRGKGAASIYDFLLNTEHAVLVERAISNSAGALAIAVPVHPSQRNAAGWMLMHHGICLVGGNVSEIEDNRKIGGCYNGGPEFGRPGEGDFAAVPGGSRNCIRCRWFVTEPHYLPALAAHFNTAAYRFDEARNSAMDNEHRLQQLRREKASQEAAGDVFTELQRFLQAERISETSMKNFSDRAEDLVACWRLIERCKDLLNAAPSDGAQLLLQGAITDVKALFEETDSELLQLCGVCDSVELYPDLDASKAVIRRSQLLDSALLNDGLPPMFLRLNEEDQLKVGNAFMRRLSQAAEPSDLYLGQRAVVGIMDAGGKLGEALGLDLSRTIIDLTPGSATPPRTFRIGKNDSFK
ncbi:VPA1269 family protein [Mitsuaria sp. CC2]|uniref:gamma-mobile-trio integrase GmtZ n=1 Tax=Mitsuaria sp. CC2 TaxID=3029186 RepID=UPI003B8D9579